MMIVEEEEINLRFMVNVVCTLSIPITINYTVLSHFPISLSCTHTLTSTMYTGYFYANIHKTPIKAHQHDPLHSSRSNVSAIHNAHRKKENEEYGSYEATEDRHLSLSRQFILKQLHRRESQDRERGRRHERIRRWQC